MKEGRVVNENRTVREVKNTQKLKKMKGLSKERSTEHTTDKVVLVEEESVEPTIAVKRLKSSTILKVCDSGEDSSSIVCDEIEMNGCCYIAIPQNVYKTVIEPRLECPSKMHDCPDVRYCGKVGEVVSEHYGAHWRCHPFFQRKENIKLKHQGVCVLNKHNKSSKGNTTKQCSNRDATMVCLRCSTIDKPMYICSRKSCAGRIACIDVHVQQSMG